MTADLAPIAAFLIGLLGSVHCVGMCGGIVGVLNAQPATTPRTSHFTRSLAYNAGRIGSYVLAGCVAGVLGSQVMQVFAPDRAHTVGFVLSGAFMIALGLYLAGWWNGLAHLERIGALTWKRIEPWGRRLFPVRRPAQALCLGALWGWLPCGLVYSTLVWSLASGNALQGGLLMLAFGIGTMPMLLAMGLAANRLPGLMRQAWVRRSAGSVIIVFGVMKFLGAFQPHQMSM